MPSSSSAGRCCARTSRARSRAVEPVGRILRPERLETPGVYKIREEKSRGPAFVSRGSCGARAGSTGRRTCGSPARRRRARAKGAAVSGSTRRFPISRRRDGPPTAPNARGIDPCGPPSTKIRSDRVQSSRRTGSVNVNVEKVVPARGRAEANRRSARSGRARSRPPYTPHRVRGRPRPRRAAPSSAGDGFWVLPRRLVEGHLLEALREGLRNLGHIERSLDLSGRSGFKPVFPSGHVFASNSSALGDGQLRRQRRGSNMRLADVGTGCSRGRVNALGARSNWLRAPVSEGEGKGWVRVGCVVARSCHDPSPTLFPKGEGVVGSTPETLGQAVLGGWGWRALH